MPWKLVFYVVLLGIILGFVGLNLENSSDISFGFIVMEDVPVFLSLFSAFLVGMLVTLPIAVRSSSNKTRARAESRRKRSEKRENKSNAKKGRRGLFRGNRGRPAHESGAVGEGGSTGDGPR